MRGIARKSAPINVIVHYPKTEQGKRELAERVAGVHADMVNQYIKKLNCPSDQKAELLGAVIASAKKEVRAVTMESRILSPTLTQRYFRELR